MDLDGEVVENLIDFTYTGTIELTLQEVQAMLVAANQLKFITVVRVSRVFVFKSLQVSVLLFSTNLLSRPSHVF